MARTSPDKLPSKPLPRTEYSEPWGQPFHCEGESLTHQSFGPECDINNIVRKHASGQMVTHVNPNTPRFADVTPMDFREAMELTRAVQEEFEGLPASKRSEYANNPELYLADLLRQQEEAAEQQNAAGDESRMRERVPESVATDSVPPSSDHAGSAGE